MVAAPPAVGRLVRDAAQRATSAAGAVLFVKPVQVVLLARLLGARRPTRDERARLDTAWRSVLQAADLPPRRYVLAVLPADELNAFACGGHLVIVTTFALETLPRDELAGVLAHELSHHLGLHTVALTITHWLSVPVLVLARIGFFLQNVASAATTSYACHSAALTALGRLISAFLTGVSWVFLSGLLAANAVGNAAGTRLRVPGRRAGRRARFRPRARRTRCVGSWRTAARSGRRRGASGSPRGIRRRGPASHASTPLVAPRCADADPASPPTRRCPRPEPRAARSPRRGRSRCRARACRRSRTSSPTARTSRRSRSAAACVARTG